MGEETITDPSKSLKKSIDSSLNKLDQEMEDFEPWYILWEDYIDSYYHADSDDDCVPLLFFHINEERWYIYNQKKGVYVAESWKYPVRLKRIFHDWADNVHKKHSITDCNLAFERLASKYNNDCIWDEGIIEFDGKTYSHIINIKDGLLDTEERVLVPHTPKYFSKNQIPRHYHPQIKERPEELVRLYSSSPDSEKFQKMAVKIIHRNFTHDHFLICYGRTGTGKSTGLNIFAHIYGEDNASGQDLYQIGTQFGMSLLYDKMINVHSDLPMSKFTPGSVSRVKTLTGDTKKNQPVEFKRGTPFMYPVHVHLCFGINQLPEFESTTARDVDSIMRRAVLVYYPTIQMDDDEFQDRLISDDFLDIAFSYWINCDIEEFYSNREEKLEWIRSNNELWFLNCDPILQFLKDEFIYDDTQFVKPGTFQPTVNSIKCDEVERDVRDMLLNEGKNIPNDLISDITHAFKQMNVLRSTRRGQESVYLKVRRKTKDERMEMLEGEINSELETSIEEPPKRILNTTDIRITREELKEILLLQLKKLHSGNGKYEWFPYADIYDPQSEIINQDRQLFDEIIEELCMLMVIETRIYNGHPLYRLNPKKSVT